MTIISKLKSLLGLDGHGRDRRGTTVTVEREPRAESERAVKESPGPSADEPADASGAEPSTEPEPASASPEITEAVDEPEPATANGPADDVAAEGSAEPVEHLSGIGPAYAGRLAEVGVETVGDLAAADAADLAESTGIGEGRVSDWIERARSS